MLTQHALNIQCDLQKESKGLDKPFHPVQQQRPTD